MTFHPPNQLPFALSDNLLWDEFTRAVDEFLLAHVQGYIDQLSALRNLSPELERKFKELALRQIGYTLDDATLKGFSPEDVFLLIYDFASFTEHSGTQDFEKFLSRLLKSEVKVKPLWTENYVDFSPVLPPGSVTVDEGGPWFLSTHVSINFNWVELERLTLSGTSLKKRIFDIFYHFAPINLVLKDIGGDLIIMVDPLCVCADQGKQVVIQYV